MARKARFHISQLCVRSLLYSYLYVTHLQCLYFASPCDTLYRYGTMIISVLLKGMNNSQSAGVSKQTMMSTDFISSSSCGKIWTSLWFGQATQLYLILAKEFFA